MCIVGHRGLCRNSLRVFTDFEGWSLHKRRDFAGSDRVNLAYWSPVNVEDNRVNFQVVDDKGLYPSNVPRVASRKSHG